MNPLTGSVPGGTLAEIESYFDRLWPLPRSITGDGVRETHNILGELVDLQRHEIPSGTKVLDWEIPKEWRVKEAYVVKPDGERILDFHQNNLHLVNYSQAFSGKMRLEQLSDHLHVIPELPEAIPYVTSYYAPYWGFCLSQRMRNGLPDGEYQVVVDTELTDGSLTLSDAVLPGRSDQEVLISTYTCHPSLANNELSGPLVAAFLYRRLAALKNRRLSYRFVFAPETIGTIAYLDTFGDHLLEHLKAGYVVSCIGDREPLRLKQSRRGNSLADRAARFVLGRKYGADVMFDEFYPSGSDERQYCSPGFNLPVALLARSFTSYPEYHTSFDDKNLISFSSIQEAVDTCFEICRVLDGNMRPYATVMKGEPFLTRYGLQSSLGAQRDRDERVRVLKWLLNYSDGEHDLIEIAEKSGADFDTLLSLVTECEQAGLLVKRTDTC